MILNPKWLKPKEKPYFHQISMDCLEKLVEDMESIDIGEMDADTSCQIEKQILTDEIQDTEFLEFAIEINVMWFRINKRILKFSDLC